MITNEKIQIRKFDFIVIWIVVCILVIGLATLSFKLEKIAEVNENLMKYRAEYINQTKDLQNKDSKIDHLNSIIDIQQDIIKDYRERWLILSDKSKDIPKPIDLDTVSCTEMEITAYDLSVESCGKPPDHPEYGITASGNRVKEWYTIACDPSIPFGTKIYIPYFKDAPNRGVFTTEDRGGAIKGNKIDVYMKSHQACMNFGRRRLKVYILS